MFVDIIVCTQLQLPYIKDNSNTVKKNCIASFIINNEHIFKLDLSNNNIITAI